MRTHNKIIFFLVAYILSGGCTHKKSQIDNETGHKDTINICEVSFSINYDSIRASVRPSFLIHPMEVFELINDCIYMFTAGDTMVTLNYNYDLNNSWITIDNQKIDITGEILLDAIYHDRKKLIFTKIDGDNEIIQTINLSTGEIHELYYTSAVKEKNYGSRRHSRNLKFLDGNSAIFFRDHPFLDVVTFFNNATKRFDLSKMPASQGKRDVGWVYGLNAEDVIVVTASDKMCFQCELRHSLFSIKQGKQISFNADVEKIINYHEFFSDKLNSVVHASGLNLLYYPTYNVHSQVKSGYYLQNDKITPILGRNSDYRIFINCMNANTVHIPINFYGRKPNYAVKQFEGNEVESLLCKLYESESISQSDLDILTKKQTAIAGIVLLGKYGYTFPENYSAGIYLNSFDFYRFIVGNTSVGKEVGNYPSTPDLSEVIHRMSDQDIYNLSLINNYYSAF